MHVSVEAVDDMLANSSHESKHPCPFGGCTRSFDTEDSLEQHCTVEHSATTMDVDFINQVRHKKVPAEMVMEAVPEYENLGGAADEDFAPARNRSRDRAP